MYIYITFIYRYNPIVYNDKNVQRKIYIKTILTKNICRVLHIIYIYSFMLQVIYSDEYNNTINDKSLFRLYGNCLNLLYIISMISETIVYEYTFLNNFNYIL